MFCHVKTVCNSNSVPIKEVLLKHCHVHLLMYCLCLFLGYNQRLEQVCATETIYPRKSKIFTIWNLTEKLCSLLM